MLSTLLTIFCRASLALSVSLPVSLICVQAQSVSAPSVANPTSAAASSVTSNLAAVNSTTTRHDDPARASAAEPKIRLQHPALNLEITADQKRLHSLSVSPSGEDQEYAPRNFNASAYSLRGRTRSGTHVRRGVIAADPRVLPLGTVVQLQAGHHSGVYTVHDTGGAIKGRRIDIWMPSTREARRFGRRRVKLVVLQYPHGRKPGKSKK